MFNVLNYSKSLDYGIKIFYNVLSRKERIGVLTQFKPYLHKIEDFPGLQTNSDLHTICKNNSSFINPFDKIKKRIKISNQIDKSWINYTDKEFNYTYWHNHLQSSYDKTCVYMLESPEKSGTWFMNNNQIYKVKAPTNSLILFPSHLIHTVPSNIKKPRYSLAIDFLER